MSSWCNGSTSKSESDKILNCNSTTYAKGLVQVRILATTQNYARVVERYTLWFKMPAPSGLRVQISPRAPTYDTSRAGSGKQTVRHFSPQ